MTFEEYVALEEKNELRHEYDDGEVFAMAEGSALPVLSVIDGVCAGRFAGTAVDRAVRPNE
jgi:hypothetical protein